MKKHDLYFTTPLSLKRLLPAFLILSALTGCYTRQAYYSSPFNGNNNVYQTIPMQCDSIKSASYINGTVFLGTANVDGTDHITAMHGSISQSRNFGRFQAYYGGNLTMGSYNMGQWDTSRSYRNSYGGVDLPPSAFVKLNEYSGGRYFGGVGFAGGMNLVTTFRIRARQIQGGNSLDSAYDQRLRRLYPRSGTDSGKIGWRIFDPRFRRSDPRFSSDDPRTLERNRKLREFAEREHVIEWRIIGFETSMTHEFGDYLQLRKQLPDSAATLIVRNSFFATFGLTTELLRQVPGGQIGWKFSTGWALGSSYNFLQIQDNESGRNIGGYGYFSFALHYTVDPYTAFFQISTATKAREIHFGINYQIGGKKSAN
jgi:hypothetical protein